MKDKVKAASEAVKGFFGKLGKKALVGIGIALGAIVLIAIIATVVLNNRPYTVLFTGLSSQETSSILSYLQENGVVDYKLENNDTILVPEGQEAALKVKLLMEGYPKSGFGYPTYFENVGSLSTESERNVAFLISLQERMEAVIRGFEGVKDAAVNIVQGEDRRYVLDDSNMVEATATVTVTLDTGAKLSNQQVLAIRNLVAHSVQGLQIENVSIQDTMGNFYTPDDETYASADASALKLRLEEQESNKIRTYIMQVLSPLFGEDNVRVSVNCTVDVSRSVVESVNYTQPEWGADGSTGGRGIIGSRVYDYSITRNGEGPAGGVAGTENNSDISAYVEDQIQRDGNETGASMSGQDDYLVDKTTEQTNRPAGVLTDVMVAVSINSTTAGAVNTTQLTSHVARAAGIVDADAAARINILTMPFYETDEEPLDIMGNPIPTWVLLAAGGGLLLFLLLLVIIMLIHGKKRKKKQKQQEFIMSGMTLPEEAAPVTGADVMSIQTEKSMELRKDIRQFADENPEIAAQMVKAWLRGGDDNG